MEGSGWLGIDPTASWSGIDSNWSSTAHSWNPMMPAMMGGGPSSMGLGRGLTGVSGVSSGGGGNNWPVVQTGWTDLVGFGADKDNEWGVPDNWGIEPPPGYQQNLLMDDSGFEGLGGMFMGGIGNFIMGGGVGGCGFPRSPGPNSGSSIGGGVGGGGGAGEGGGLESDPIDFDIDGLLSTSPHDSMGPGPAGSSSGAGSGDGGSIGGGGGGMFGMQGMMGGAVGTPDWCQGVACCLQQGGGGGGYPFI